MGREDLVQSEVVAPEETSHVHLPRSRSLRIQIEFIFGSTLNLREILIFHPERGQEGVVPLGGGVEEHLLVPRRAHGVDVGDAEVGQEVAELNFISRTYM